jgi:hypothetical protein
MELGIAGKVAFVKGADSDSFRPPFRVDAGRGFDQSPAGFGEFGVFVWVSPPGHQAPRH